MGSATDQGAVAWSEAGSPRITEFRLSAQPQKFETITVTIGYKNGQLLRLRVILITFKTLQGLAPKYLQDLVSVLPALYYCLRRG